MSISPKKIVSNFISGKENKDELEKKMEEKQKIFGYIGMEFYEQYSSGTFELSNFKIYFDKLKEIDMEIKRMQGVLVPLANECSKLCPGCGEKLSSASNFCPFCGTNLADLPLNETVKESNKTPNVQKKKCICGAELDETQAICLSCGRLV